MKVGDHSSLDANCRRKSTATRRLLRSLERQCCDGAHLMNHHRTTEQAQQNKSANRRRIDFFKGKITKYRRKKYYLFIFDFFNPMVEETSDSTICNEDVISDVINGNKSFS